MQLLKREMGQVKVGDTTRINFIGDCHIGHSGCAKNTLRRTVSRIAKQDNSWVVLMGDIMDSIAVSDPRFQETSLDGDVRKARRDDIINAQTELAEDILAPIKGRILMCLIGNHEEVLVRRTNSDPLRILARQLDAPYEAAYCGYLRLHWKQGTANGWGMDIMAHHGAGGGYLSGAKINRVERRAGWWSSADIVASGHVHKRAYTTSIDLRVPTASMTVLEHVQHCLITGSYLKGYLENSGGSSYIERADYPPTELDGMYADITCAVSRKEGKSNSALRTVDIKCGML
jgi:UDP-2,3-diacylglucosamine pyrophosphatase LpxH